MSVYYDLLCKDCGKDVHAVSSSLAGNSCGDYQETLDFIVDHAGHNLTVLSENERWDHEKKKVVFDG